MARNKSRGNQRSQSSSSNKKPSASSDVRNRGGNQRGSASRDRGSSGEALDDLTYDVITLLHEKSKGLEAFEQYIEDASDNEEVREIFEELRDQDVEAISRLEECLRNVIGESSSDEMEEEEEEVA